MDQTVRIIVETVSTYMESNVITGLGAVQGDVRLATRGTDAKNVQ